MISYHYDEFLKNPDYKYDTFTPNFDYNACFEPKIKDRRLRANAFSAII